ncbi:nucleotidyltransferase domain-containing protein [Geoalkalibacter subterraneus]|jgi:predicted nucleotidyltransferase|uniref:Polymerase beta nucleotidyltransferase domain-containing protein n=1 Tax=Geoalkalibacter subterraneus TaxID=483547 RepID=A0A0B5FGX1_9BACT|nr:nucleotidyltransferase domain-containing protein [Geoalkalibacter subterraneus]AJF06593.1 hypothetical protein GSUB_08560 [Geoalkalibacter subterraneus]
MTADNEFGISPTDLARIVGVFEHHEDIDEVVLYGSRAKGNYRPGSDIDLTLCGENLNLRTLNRVSNDLDDLLLPYSFDVSIYSQIENEDLIDHIQRVGVTIYRVSGERLRQVNPLG